MNVPFVDLKVQYMSIKEEIDTAIAEIFETSSFVGGPIVDGFERDFAKYAQINHCVSCANGTDAIEIALQVLGIGAGDEVIVPAMSWISTSEAVSTVGATPVFADIHPESYTIDPADVEKKISLTTKAIIPVHLYGRPAEMDKLMAIAKKHQLKVIEDTAQGHGARLNGQQVGTFGDMATFSFYPGKNLGAYGDGGAIVTHGEALAAACRRVSNHGQQSKHHHLHEGRNSRMDTLQAAVLLVKLKYIDQWTEARIAKAKYYTDQLEGLPVKTPAVDQASRHVFHVYAIRIENRMEVQQKLLDRGIVTQIHYPQSLPELMPYRDMFDSDEYPVAKTLAATTLSLPLFAEITREQQDYVIHSLRDILK